MNAGLVTPEPLLRTLAPALRHLRQEMRKWIDAPELRFPLSTIAKATLEGLDTDLARQAEALDVDRPLLVIMLMGGTGVGKSTLLNALAGDAIAQASFTRPTTRDPVVYYHHSIKPERLDPALRHCRLAPHDRQGLEYKIIVDTPDLDSNDLANRDKLQALLPVADVVLYVGSQEKYHDKLGWELFLQQRKRRAFAFVLNKWDRCVQAGAQGLRPDEDLLRDLQAEGFKDPLIFRTCAQYWVGTGVNNGQFESAPASDRGAAADLDHEAVSVNGRVPEGEQFQELVAWLEQGLTRLEIEAIKARGVSQLLQHLQKALAASCPPDLTEEAGRVNTSWQHLLKEEAEATSGVLLNTLEPFQREIEHHFAIEGQRRFRGLMAAYLHLFTRVRFVGNSLRDRISLLPKSKGPSSPASAAWDLKTFTRACTDAAATRHLDARSKALSNRLLVEADAFGFPINLLAERVEAASCLDWRQRHSQALIEIVHDVEQQWSHPKGGRRLLQGTLVVLADWLPPLALLAALGQLLWRFFDPLGKGYPSPQLFDIFLPALIVLVVLVILHLVIALLLPLRWGAIRGQFRGQLERKMQAELEAVYGPIPGDLAAALLQERKRVEKLQAETKEVADWLSAQEHAASIGGLYGA